MTELKEKHCKPCESGTNPFNAEEISKHLEKLPAGWEEKEGKMIRKSFPFENFKQGMAFAQNVALLSEEEQHHPDVCIQYKNVDIELTTHSIGGLSENDFIMASKIEDL